MSWESATELVSGITNGWTVYGVKRIYSLILTAGVDDATAILSWESTHFGGTRTIHIRCDSTTGTSIYSPIKPLVIDAEYITITTTGTSPTLELTSSGYDRVEGPTANLVSRATVLLELTDELVSRLITRRKSTKSIVSQITGRRYSSTSLVDSLTVTYTYTFKPFTNTVTIRVYSGKALIAQIAIPHTGATKNLVCQVTPTNVRGLTNLTNTITLLLKSTSSLVCQMDVQQLA